jgi:hypothetical protein
LADAKREHFRYIDVPIAASVERVLIRTSDSSKAESRE